MKIAIPVSEKNLDLPVEPCFDQAAYFLIIESDTPEEYEIIDNASAKSLGNSGVLEAQMLINLGVEVIFSEWCEPQALRVFRAAGVTIREATKETPREIIRSLKLKEIDLTQSSQSSEDDPVTII